MLGNRSDFTGERRLQSYGLSGKTLGVVGFGRIGQAVVQRALSFGVRVQYADPIQDAGFLRVPLDMLLATSDYVSLHLPLTPQTRGLVSASRIAMMPKGAILINTARGEVLDEPALIEALQSGHLAGAGLDVFAQEPPAIDNPLLSMPNVVLTPHIASGTSESLHRKAAWYAANIARVLSGNEAIDLVPAASRLLVPG